MRCKNLFSEGNVIFLRDYSTARIELEKYAKNNGLKIKITVGIWVNTPETEKVLRVELLDCDSEKMSEKKKQTYEKIKLYRKMLNEGMTQAEIAKTLGVSREAVNNFIIYHHIKKEQTDD